MRNIYPICVYAHLYFVYISIQFNSIQFNSIQLNSILYFNVLTQQQQEPITESAQENNKCTKICLCVIHYLQNNNINNDNRTNYCSYSH
jgi:hypothetical protein